MTDARLKQTERLEVFRLITDAGFDPADFTWSQKQDHESFRSNMGGGDEVIVSVLFHTPTAYYMRFGAFANEFSPGVKRRVEYDEHDLTWATRIRGCKTWLKELRKEVDAPDLWAALGKERSLSDAASSSLENGPFTPTELGQITGALNELKHYILAVHSVQGEQTEFMERQFRYLAEAATRVGRKDWLLLLYATLVNQILTVALPPEKAQSLLQLAGTLLHGLWDKALGLLTQ